MPARRRDDQAHCAIGALDVLLPGVPALSPLHPVRRPLVFTTVALALLMMSVDSTIVATALHALRHGLGTSINRVPTILAAPRRGLSSWRR